ncbi:unnamed protein product [Prunus armeniaca]|uniref:Uncharacterized protein n=1 Tax=Prunus armeniaca TaxID=36596 RepID=A0A6J5XDI2_PRUAR|nr:unnamed protein product [Prunus armeniaca]
MTKPPPTSPPDLPCKVRLLLSILTTVLNTVRRSNGTINRRLISLFDLKASPSSKPNNHVRTCDVMVDPTRKPLVSPLRSLRRHHHYHDQPLRQAPAHNLLSRRWLRIIFR